MKVGIDSLRLMFGRSRWKSNSSKSVEACPRCRSLNIQLSSKFDAWLMPKQYVCRDCGYIGPVVLEIEKIEKDADHNG